MAAERGKQQGSAQRNVTYFSICTHRLDIARLSQKISVLGKIFNRSRCALNYEQNYFFITVHSIRELTQELKFS
jgi:hypothetical protein